MAAGEFFDLVRPVLLVFSALVSIWVLASARRRFPLYQSLLWAVGTLFFPLIVLPAYWTILLLTTRPRVNAIQGRFALPLMYGAIVLASVSLYLFSDYRSVDSHLSRATQAKLKGDLTTTIAEYRKALALDDDPHTHKLLGIELAEAGYPAEAIHEFRLAEQGGEPDSSIHFRMGRLLEKTNYGSEAKMEYQRFLFSTACAHESMDYRCDDARQRLSNLSGNSNRGSRENAQ